MIFEQMKESAVKEAFLLKRSKSLNVDPSELQDLYEYIRSDRFDSDIDRLIRGDYYFDLPTLIFLRKGQSDKKRKVYRFTPENKFVLQFINFMMCDRYDDIFCDRLYSSRKNLSRGRLFDAIRRYDPGRTKHIIQVDIKSFGESTDPEVIGARLKTILADEPELHSFIMWLITRNRFYRDGEITEGFTSVIPGNPIVNFFHNVSLMEIDDYMKANSVISSRYADDICMMCDDLESAEYHLANMKEIIGRSHLKVNESKTGIVLPGEEFDLLGIKFGAGFTDIADNTYIKTFTRMRHRANSLDRRIKSGRLTKEEGLRRMASYISDYYYSDNGDKRLSWTEQFFPYITSDKRLRKLDHLSQECIRFVATGRMTNAKYRFRYKDISRLGYVPLVRSFHSRIEVENNQDK